MQNALPDGIYSLMKLSDRLKGDVWQYIFRTISILSTVEMEKKTRNKSTKYKVKRKLHKLSEQFL
jgi:hypothetical protein